MEKEKIRHEIATDLKGKPSRNPQSLIPTLAKTLGISVEEVYNQVHQMTDIGHIVPVGQASIRLSEMGEQFYFSTKEERVSNFLQRNWPHLLSNGIALFALIVAIFALLRG